MNHTILITILITLFIVGVVILVIFQITPFRIVKKKHEDDRKAKVKIQVMEDAKGLYEDVLATLHRKINYLENKIERREHKIVFQMKQKTEIKETVSNAIHELKMQLNKDDFWSLNNTPVKVKAYLKGYIDSMVNTMNKL